MFLRVVALAAWPQESATEEPPRLVVFISIDQMRSDYIDKYGPRWTAGLKRLVTQGARFVQAAYPYFNTVTCAGHATMSTGAFPSTHGMVLNAWWDRTAGKDVACTDDPSCAGHQLSRPRREGRRQQPVAAAHAHLRGRAARTGSRAHPHVVAALSMKPRSAIMLAGHQGDAVIWFDSAGGFTTSTAFAEADAVRRGVRQGQPARSRWRVDEAAAGGQLPPRRQRSR